MSDADEYDALTWAKKFYHWRPGQRREIKRRARRRDRRHAQRLIAEELSRSDYEQPFD